MNSTNNKIPLLFPFLLLFHFMVFAQKNDLSTASGVERLKPNEFNQFDLSFFANPKEKMDAKYELLLVGDVKPQGWLKEIMIQDLNEGFVGYLDQLAPKLMSNKPFSDRRTSIEDIPVVGDQALTGAAWEVSMQWWPGESIPQWWDGYLRNAFLVEDEKAIERSHKMVKYFLSTQDEDGYIGIYSENMRYKHEGSNGELWSQTALFRMLLAYYEITGDKEVLKAVERAMAVTMKYYNRDSRSPFYLIKESYGGVSHGLIMTDVCEMLYRITKDQKYQDYAVFLYEDYCANPMNRSMNNVRYEYLMEKDVLYESHSVHTFEHLRSLINAYYETGYPQLAEAYESAMNKLSYTILPSGAGFGNEWQNREKAKPDSTGAEFCGMFELRDFYTSVFQKTGDISFADEIERITYNSMQGSRDHTGSAIVYCKVDNCYELNNVPPQGGDHSHDFRYKYSPTHADAAVCCNPSYAKHWPYFVSKMWMKAQDGLVAAYYGPSKLSTKINNQKVEIEQFTNYPMSDEIEFKISVENSADFAIYFRKPQWAKDMLLTIEGATISFENGLYKVRKKWSGNESISLTFVNEVLAQSWEGREVYFQRGPLVFAYDIPHREEITKDYDLADFHDYFCFSEEDDYKNISFTKEAIDFELISNSSSEINNPWYKDNWYLSGSAINKTSGKLKEIKLIPMGNTVLRRVTFPVN